MTLKVSAVPKLFEVAAFSNKKLNADLLNKVASGQYKEESTPTGRVLRVQDNSGEIAVHVPTDQDGEYLLNKSDVSTFQQNLDLLVKVVGSQVESLSKPEQEKVAQKYAEYANAFYQFSEE